MTPLPPWRQIGRTDPRHLMEARLQAHWAAQLLSAAADDALPPATDDSHSNVFWDDQQGALVGRDLGGIRLALRFSDFQVLGLTGTGTEEVLPLEGITLAQAKNQVNEFLSRALGRTAELALRNYEMPRHPVSEGAPFGGSTAEARSDLAAWYSNGTALLQTVAATEPTATEIAIWPHHFDIGGILFLDSKAPAERAPQIGFGMSPGDHHLEKPYFYVTAWPISESAEMSGLPHGRWTREGFAGAVLDADDIGAVEQARQAEAVAGFLRSAFEQGKALVAAHAHPHRNGEP